MPIEIKLLTPHDADILKNVAPGLFDDPIDIPHTKEFLHDPRHHLSVAIDNDLVVGFISAVHYVHPDKPHPELWLNEVSVAPTHRRQGLATRLLHSLFDLARSLGCAQAWVLTDRSNTAAMHLYARAAAPNPPSDHVMFTFPLIPAPPTQ